MDRVGKPDRRTDRKIVSTLLSLLMKAFLFEIEISNRNAFLLYHVKRDERREFTERTTQVFHLLTLSKAQRIERAKANESSREPPV